MKVALVCPYSLDQPGGVARHVLGLAGWLREHGHDARVVAPGTNPPGGPVPVTLVGRGVPLRFNGSVAHLALRPAQLRRALSAVTDADVIHVHEPLTPGLGFGVARRSPSLVVTHHASFDPGPLSCPLRTVARLLPRRIALAVSAAAADTAEAVTGNRPDIVPNAIVLPPPPPAPRPEDAPVVFVGRGGEPRKGYPTFLQVAAAMPDTRFVAAGPGTVAADNVTALGQVTDAELSDLLGEAAVLVAPNGFGESFGMILIEALAHGAAVVASDLPAFRDVCDDPAVATFFPVGDVTAAVAAVRDRLWDPVDPERARRSVEAFTWDAVGPRIVDAYGRAAALRPGAHGMF